MNKISTIEDLLAVEIIWHKRKDDFVRIAVVLGENVQLTLNNFPEEPLYTLYWKEKTMDIDDAPKNWVIE